MCGDVHLDKTQCIYNEEVYFKSGRLEKKFEDKIVFDMETITIPNANSDLMHVPFLIAYTGIVYEDGTNNATIIETDPIIGENAVE